MNTQQPVSATCVLAVCLALASLISAKTLAGEWDCGRLQNHFGPWDYYDPENHRSTGEHSQGRIRIVTNRHLTRSMLMLQGGSTGPLAGDLDYTLKAIPNHPLALDLASRFEHRRNSFKTFAKQHKAMPLSAECYFERAFRFRPNQSEVLMIYGMHKHRYQEYREAVESYEKAMAQGSRDVQLKYNLALSYLSIEEFDKANELAKTVYGQGYPLQGLKNKLIKLGKWGQ